jgi:hypothetical protein
LIKIEEMLGTLSEPGEGAAEAFKAEMSNDK